MAVRAGVGDAGLEDRDRPDVRGGSPRTTRWPGRCRPSTSRRRRTGDTRRDSARPAARPTTCTARTGSSWHRSTLRAERSRSSSPRSGCASTSTSRRCRHSAGRGCSCRPQRRVRRPQRTARRRVHEPGCRRPAGRPVRPGCRRSRRPTTDAMCRCTRRGSHRTAPSACTSRCRAWSTQPTGTDRRRSSYLAARSRRGRWRSPMPIRWWTAPVRRWRRRSRRAQCGRSSFS